MYRSEAAFSAALRRSWKAKGYFVQRVESPTTGRGTPDLYVETPDYGYWIELKVEHVPLLPKAVRSVQVHWRPGQQAWMLSKYRASGCTRPCFTFVAFDDCIAAISMTKVFPGNEVQKSDILRTWKSAGDIFL